MATTRDNGYVHDKPLKKKPDHTQSAAQAFSLCLMDRCDTFSANDRSVSWAVHISHLRQKTYHTELDVQNTHRATI